VSALRVTTLLSRCAAAAILGLAAVPARGFEAQVVGPDGKPLAGCEVSILGRSGVVRTDAAGRFAWRPDPPTPFDVLVVVAGGRVMKPLRVESLPDGQVLRLAVAALEESVTVTAGAAPGIEGSPASASAVFAAREFGARQPANLNQLLENVAGVSQVSEGHAAVPAIRGLAKGRTLILIDGARVTSERRVGPSASFLDPAALESVEISRGPATVAYGSDAFGGVINARTRAAVPGSGFGGRLVGSAGAGVPDRRAALELRQAWSGLGLLAQGHWRAAGDYESPRGRVFNSGFQDYGFRARADRYATQAVWTASWQTDLGRDVERPRNNSRSVRFFYPREDSHRATVSYDAAQALGFNRLGANAFFGTHALVTDQDRSPTATTPRRVERSDVFAKDYHLRAFAQRLVGGARLDAGLDLNGRFGLHALEIRQRYAADAVSVAETESSVAVDDARRMDAAVYAAGEGRLARRLALGLGLRGDRVTTRNQAGFFGDRSSAHTAASGFVSLTAGPFGALTATAQVARGFRDPALSDRYYRGPTGRGFITGNPALAPETSLQLDSSLRYAAARWRAELHAYQYGFDELIERYQPDVDFFFFRNRGEARIRGLELELHGELAAGFGVSLVGHAVRARALGEDAHLDDAPADTLTLQLRKTFGERGSLHVRGALFAADERPGPTEVARDGYQAVDVWGRCRIAGRLEIGLSVRNLLGEEYLISPDARAELAPGRSLLLTAGVSF
jgi:outer membrane receptor protein involved in Fe transport